MIKLKEVLKDEDDSVIILETKVCGNKNCIQQNPQPLTNFTTYKGNACSYCKSCKKAYDREYRKR
jgi:aspartate carbamoyltransferase regulatory subunit